MAIIGLLLIFATAARAADPGSITMRIEMFGLGGLHIATNHTTVEEAAGRYAITTDVKSRGIASVLVSVTSHSEVRGALLGEAAHPHTYRGEVNRNGVDTLSRVDYGGDGTVIGESTPPGKTHIPVTPALMRGTVDQLTAFFMLERQLASRGSCALVVAVFDGRRRYNLHFADTTGEALQATSGAKFGGSTQACTMRREAIAGFADDSGRTEGGYEGKLWYARLLPGDLMIPVQMDFNTEFGAVKGYLGEVHGRGLDLQFMD